MDHAFSPKLSSHSRIAERERTRRLPASLRRAIGRSRRAASEINRNSDRMVPATAWKYFSDCQKPIRIFGAQRVSKRGS